MFIEKLDEILKKRKMSGAELSKRLGLSSSNYSYWKKGNKPNADILEKIARELNITTDWLLGISENPKEESEIISFYRKADERGKDRIYKTAKDEADQMDKIKETPSPILENNITKFPKETKPFA